MQRAEYTLTKDKLFSEMKHSALNFELYTHFTSPIRRYPDIVVHRQMKFILNKMNLLRKRKKEDEKEKEKEEKKSDFSSSKKFLDFLVKNVLEKIKENPENEIDKNKSENLLQYEKKEIINYEELIDHFNERYYNGKQISQKCQKFFQFIFLKNIPEQIYKGLIVDISNKIPQKNKRNLQQNNFESQTLFISLFIPSLNIEIVKIKKK